MAKVLIVDDDDTLAAAIAQFLTAEGHAVSVCTDPAGAEKAVLDGKPDLAILDYMMPGRKGTEILASLRAREETRRLPVIFLSGNDALRYSSEVPPEPRVRFQRKPVDFQALVALMSGLLDPEGWSA